MGQERLCVLLLALILWLGGAPGTPSLAAKWRFEPRISANVTYTDNVDLDDNVKQSDLVLRVEPGFFVKAEGDRLKLEASYDGSFLSFVDDGRTEWRNHLRSKFLVEPFENYFFISGSAVMAEPFVDETSSVTFSSDNISRNRRRVMSFGISPYLRHRVGHLADVEWRYELRHVRVQDPDVDDPTPRYIENYTGHVGQVTVDSGDRFNRLHWNLLGRYEDTTREGGGRNGDEVRVEGDIEYRVLSWLGVLGSAGWQRLKDPDLISNINDFIWDAGLRINPTRNTDIIVTYGRDNGDNRFAAKAFYKRKRIRVGITYANEISRSQRRFSQVVGDASFDPNDIYVDPFGSALEPDDAVYGFQNETFRSRRVLLQLMYEHRRTRIDLDGYYEERSFDLTMQEVREYNVRVRINRDFNKHLRGTVDLRYRHTDFDRGPSRMDDFYGIRTSLIYQFSEDLSGRLSYIFSTLNSNISTNNRTENVIVAWMRTTF